MSRESVKTSISRFLKKTYSSWGNYGNSVEQVSADICNRCYDTMEFGSRKTECLAGAMIYMAQDRLSEMGYFDKRQFDWFEKNDIGCLEKNIENTYNFIKDKIGTLKIVSSSNETDETQYLMDIFNGKRAPGQDIDVIWEQ